MKYKQMKTILYFCGGIMLTMSIFLFLLIPHAQIGFFLKMMCYSQVLCGVIAASTCFKNIQTINRYINKGK